jgi:hypothetical protein
MLDAIRDLFSKNSIAKRQPFVEKPAQLLNGITLNVAKTPHRRRKRAGADYRGSSVNNNNKHNSSGHKELYSDNRPEIQAEEVTLECQGKYITP